MRCPDHPAYNGIRELSKRKCSGCGAVRMEYLHRIKKKKSQSKGTHLSISTPGFNCTLAHLLTEIALFISYGPLPKYFWRKGASTQTIRNQFQKTFMIINGMLQRRGRQDVDFVRQFSQFIRNSYSHVKVANIVEAMENEHKTEVDKEERGIEMEKEKGEAFIDKSALNIFLDEELLNGETKEKSGTS